MNAEQIRNDPEAMGLIVQYNLARAAAARENIEDFFEYVMREETTRAPLVLAPHQRITLSFIMAHPRCVVMMPPGHSKTFLTTALGLYLTGHDLTLRGAIISGAQAQAEKPLSSIRGYIENSQELRVVFPRLRPTQRQGEPWTQTAITVDRPATIRDPTFIAAGEGSKLLDGSRLKWILIDDLLNDDNVRTKEARDQTYSWLQKTVNTRLDPRGARIIVTNTARHPEDVPHRLRDRGWPTLRMGVSGNIYFEGDVRPDWGVDDRVEPGSLFRIRSSKSYEKAYRLRAHDPDPLELQTLWPERVNRTEVERIKTYDALPLEFEQLYEQNCRDDATAPCKIEYVERCKAVAQQLGIHYLAKEWRGQSDDTAFTGVDLSTGEGTDVTALVTFYVRPSDRIRVLLDVRYGMWGAPEICDQIEEVQRQYNSILRVEKNGTQAFIRQLMQSRNKSIPINDHDTTASKKMDPVFGINRIFLDMRNGAWAFPTDRNGKCQEAVQRLIDDCLFYRPSKHTPDVLMAMHLALAQAAEWGLLMPVNAGDLAQVQAIGSGVMAR